MLERVRIVLLRHASAVPHGTPGYDDADRPLLPEGEREATDAGRALRRLGVEAGRCLTSGYLRARRTAELAAEQLGTPVERARPLEPGFGAGDLPGLLADGDDTVILVGHDPDFSDVVSALTGARVSMPKGGAARVDLQHPADRAGELRWLLRPRALRLLAAGA
jgi:phosphohistidine phosphatase